MRAAATVAAASAALSILPGPASADLAERRTPVVRAVERAGPAVVNVSTEHVVELRSDPFFEQFYRDFFDARPRGRRMTQTSLGSGVLVRSDGYVVTNAHVVARGSKIRVTLADEREFDAKVVGTDAAADLAVLRISGTNLPSVDFGDSSDVMIGETVIAIGNPFGFSHSVTTGVVSATGRSLRTEGQTFLDFIQTDASINPGNSGGALLNVDGSIIGIATAIYGGAQNIGFAIPSNRARRVVDDLIRYGSVRRGDAGLRVQDLTPELASALGASQAKGAVVRDVDPGGPAEQAGLRRGDVISAVDGRDVRDAAEFEGRLRDLAPEDVLRLEVQRDGAPREVVLRARPLAEGTIEDRAWRALGFRVRPRRGGGLEIVEVRPGSRVARSGVHAGDLLLAMRGRGVESPAEFQEAVRGLGPSQAVDLVIQRGPRQYGLTVPFEE
ncbi:trypsin-like peptidase domain-containing protein [bacterium]|nr:trypsin-like peptidase domain-containing protein [bacterium]